MAYTRLNFNFQNDELDIDVNPNVKYEMTDNGDGTISLTDVSVYDTYGDAFDASTLNTIGSTVNAVELGLENAETAIAGNLAAIGNIQDGKTFKLKTTDVSGVDHDLYQAILAYGWDGYVIE